MNLDKIYDLYVKKIRRGILSIEDVPEEFRVEVLRRLENN